MSDETAQAQLRLDIPLPHPIRGHKVTVYGNGRIGWDCWNDLQDKSQRFYSTLDPDTGEPKPPIREWSDPLFTKNIVYAFCLDKDSGCDLPDDSRPGYSAKLTRTLIDKEFSVLNLVFLAGHLAEHWYAPATAELSADPNDEKKASGSKTNSKSTPTEEPSS